MFVFSRVLPLFFILSTAFTATDLIVMSNVESRIHGLPNVRLDDWYRDLFSGKFAQRPPAGLEEEIVREYARIAVDSPVESHTARLFGFLKERYARNYDRYDSHFEVARQLYAARERIRKLSPSISVRGALYLLNFLAEEALYAATLKFNGVPQVWAFKGTGAGRPCAVGGPSMGSLCEGDVVLSKGEEFSSALTLFRSPYTATFSHVAFALIHPKTGRMSLLESEGFGGSLNDPDAESARGRSSVYRLHAAHELQVKSVKGAIAKAREQVIRSPAFSRGEITTDRLFKFNFPLEPRCEPGVYFCSELVRCVYQDGGAPEELNPYTRKHWTPTTENTSAFISRIWKVNWGAVPTPGDVELNPQYELVEHRVDLVGLPQLRIQHQVLESFLSLLREDVSLRDRYAEALLSFGRGSLASLDEATTRDLLKLGHLQKDELAQLKRMLPGNVRVSEVIFYYHVQNHLLPVVEEHLQDASQEKTRIVSENRVPGVTLGTLQELARPALRKELLTFIGRMSALRGGRAP